MEIVVVDYETSIKCPIGNNKAHPMWLGNSIVAAGHYFVKDGVTPYVGKYKPDSTAIGPYPNHYVVGQNVKFDMLYAYRSTPKALLPTLWDTQLAEYIITGQVVKYASLDYLTEKYLGEEFKKDERLKEYWDSGVDTENIPQHLLMEYMKADVCNTKGVFLAQWEVAKEQGQLALLLSQMEALRATTAMALAGMAIDWLHVEKNILQYATLISSVQGELDKVAPGLDCASPKQLSTYFFGGTTTSKVREEVGLYKNGNVKYKVREVETPVVGKVDHSDYGLTLNKAGYYTTDVSVLNGIKEKSSCTEATTVATLVSDLRVYTKIKETYYEGINALRFPNGLIYPNLTHVSTSTGRLSASQPNLQNQTDIGNIKQCFISRHKGGYLVEADYSQLEVVWLAYLTGDEQLIEDINNDVDIHSVLFKEMYGREPTKQERKAFKPRSFQLIYGAGAKAIAEQGNISLDEARKFIRVFYSRYSGVKLYHDGLLGEAKKNAVVFYKDGVPGPFKQYVKKMPWGRHYVFNTYDNEWSKERTFSPTELKNYPVQGSATGDMVPLMLGVLQRELEKHSFYQEGTANLVMTVHDSVLLDVKEEVLYNVMDLVKKTLESADVELKQQLGIDFPCKLKVGISYGVNWQDMKEY